jgi:signal transduction histidine kinase
MKSLFAKLLLWFIASVLLTSFAMLIVASIGAEEDETRRPLFGSLLDVQFADARQAYLLGGKAALESHLERFRMMTTVQVVITDRDGRDLVTGQDRSELIGMVRRHPWLPILPQRRAILARFDREHGFWYFMLVPRRSYFRWFLEPEHILPLLAIITLLCWWFARHLTQPVRKLQAAVERFGRGELDERVMTTRRDELGELARTFNRMAERIKMLLAAERRLLADISHELRSPLARLSVAIELARTGDPGPQLDRIEKEADRLNSLVGELLQVTRAEGDPSQLRCEGVRLDELVEDVVEDVRVEAGARGCGIELQSSAAVEVNGDPELLRRAVENVLRNAIRYEPPGSNVEVNVGPKGVSVRDHGPGVPNDLLDRIFDPFYRVDTHRDRASGGVGLGLSIARRAIALHKGSIRAENASPGLCVRIELPTSPAEVPSYSQAGETAHLRDSR